MALRVKSEPPLAEQLRAAREAVFLTQKELGAHLGVSARTVQNWESGATPRLSNQRDIRDFIAFVNCQEAA